MARMVPNIPDPPRGGKGAAPTPLRPGGRSGLTRAV